MTTIDGDGLGEVTIDGDRVREITQDGDVVYQLPDVEMRQVLETTDSTVTYEYEIVDMGTFDEFTAWHSYREPGGSWTWDNSDTITSAGVHTKEITGLDPETTYDTYIELWYDTDSYWLGDAWDTMLTYTTEAAITWVEDFSQPISNTYMDYSSSDPADYTVTSAWGDMSSESLEVVDTSGNAGVMHSVPSSSSYATYQDDYLPYYPQPGDTIRVRFRIPHSHDGSYQGTSVNIRFRFALNGISDRWAVQVSPDLGDSPVYLYDSNNQKDSDTMGTYSADTVFDFVIEQDNNSATVDVVEVATGQVHATVSGSFSTRYGNGIGWRCTDGTSDRALIDGVWVE